MKEKEGNGFVKWFFELSNKDIAVAGGKGASLAEMYNAKFPIPPGFMITAQAYGYFIEKAGLVEKIQGIIDETKTEDTKALNEASKKIRALIENAVMPKEIEEEIIEAYDVLDVDRNPVGRASGAALEILKKSREPPFVAVRSSATMEDLADASFAGQQESFLNVKGHQQLLINVKKCFSSLFTSRAIYYRNQKGFSHTKAYLAVVVQQMVDSDKSGVMFSKNPVKNDETIMIEAVWGLGEGIVSGMIKPDNYLIGRNLDEYKIISKSVSQKNIAIVRDSSGTTKAVKLTEERANQQVLDNYELKILSGYAMKLEEHYGKPQDIEFAISGRDIFIVQSRPITTKAQASSKDVQGNVLLSGLGASPGVGSGIVKIVHDMNELDKVQKGDILVTEMTNPDMVVSMQKAAGIVTDEGGITSHAAIVSREMGIPAVVGTGTATKSLKDGMIITVDGDNGKVYEGKGESRQIEVLPIVPTRTKIKVIVDLPDFAERAALSKSEYVGLVRLEGIIAESGKHPLYFVKKKKMGDYENVIYSGLRKIAEHFKEIWVRTSDIRSDEYQHLEGAPQEKELNPMLGNHGARFSLKHIDIMKSELAAFEKLAKEFPNKIFGIMVPQIISVDELKRTKELASELNMPKNVKVGIMVETPAAVQIITDLCEEGMDFISFGTNDLTQYTLAIDRNNESIQDLYNEMNPAVLNSLRYVIRKCRKYGVETSICGQAGSKEEMVRFLLGEGIDSISCNADAAQKVSMLVAKLEGEKKVDAGVEGQMKIEMKKGMEDAEDNDQVVPASREMKNYQKEMKKVDEDIENIILQELEKDEYVTGLIEGKDIPQLNDAIPVEGTEESGEKPLIRW